MPIFKKRTDVLQPWLGQLVRLRDYRGERDAWKKGLSIDPSFAPLHKSDWSLKPPVGPDRPRRRAVQNRYVTGSQYAEAENNLGVVYGSRVNRMRRTIIQQAVENNPQYAQALFNSADLGRSVAISGSKPMRLRARPSRTERHQEPLIFLSSHGPHSPWQAH